MKKVIILIAVLLLPQVVAAQGLLEGTGLGINAEMGAYSSFVWRGFKFSEDPVQQTELELSYGPLSGGVWTSADLAKEAQSREIDYYLELSRDYGDFSFSGGHIYYVFPSEESYTAEFFLGAAYDTVSSPSITWFRDYKDGAGNYFLFDFSFPFTLSELISMDLLLAAGINDGLFLEGRGGDITGTLSFNMPLYDGLDFIPSLNYVIPLGDLADEEEDSFFGGFSLGYEF